MRRWLFFTYGAVAHTLFFGVFAYLAGFVGNLMVPKSIDSAADGPIGTAIVIDVLLLALFAAQHSIMARPGFKRYWTRIVPEPIERSTYVLLSCLVTIVLMWQWRGIDVIVWDVRQPVFRGLMWGLFVIGWLLVPLTSVLINHFDLFGTRQVWLHLRGREYEALPFRVPLFYKYVRHPLYVGFMVAFWATPTMTIGHLVFAVGLTSYMIGATLLEERDLLAHFGEQYAYYRRHVPKFIPRWKASLPAPSQTTHAAEPEPLQV
ncbi:MAG TPA: NnrU family protein [Lacipirellulaceae bacterium]|nr:NnrU family protein [Lacipirellulaceae bacterium]